MDNKNGIEPRQGSEEKRSLISKIQDFAAGLPSFEDASQKGALANIAKFLVALIALTLISRGASGAALARVSVSNPLRAPVTEAVTGKASVKAQDQHIISAPEGLTVVKALAGSGQEVKAGDD
jgi:multidrug efflux pump subunit AcrA (membrane-fusion protein)